MKSKTTLVTGIWDLGRQTLSDGWGRSFDHYIENFKRLLECKNLNLAIFIDPEIEEIVWKIRDPENTKVYHHKASEFNGSFFPFYDKVQEIRQSEQWLSQVGWLRDSTQAQMSLYNPMVMSKMFLLHNAKVFDPFNSDYFFWLDGGISNTVHPGYFSHDNVIEKIEDLILKFIFICFPYETNTEIHGFDINKMNDFCGSNVNRVARGGFFGGHKDYISKANELYYDLLNESLSQNLMGTEESIFTIMSYRDPDTYRTEMINSDGLLSTFFENIKNNTAAIQKSKLSHHKKYNKKQSVYINTYNAPEQLKILIKSFEEYEPKFLIDTDVTLINNSTNTEHFENYSNICKTYNFKEIRNGNQGICRSRQWAAEDFEKSDNKYMFFFEDDMNIDCSDRKCPFGFNKKIDNLFDTLIKIMDFEDYDFLKFSFSEFYGHNGEQWSWHNVPQNLREEYFGNVTKRPLTKFNNIKSINGTPYIDGEIYYSNWPHIIGHKGNKSCFLDTKWDHPYEQTWMSHMYTLTKQNKIRTAILLASPITHDRIYFYNKEERKEN
jgi:hypothetical protein